MQDQNWVLEPGGVRSVPVDADPVSRKALSRSAHPKYTRRQNNSLRASNSENVANYSNQSASTRSSLDSSDKLSQIDHVSVPNRSASSTNLKIVPLTRDTTNVGHNPRPQTAGTSVDLKTNDNFHPPNYLRPRTAGVMIPSKSQPREVLGLDKVTPPPFLQPNNRYNHSYMPDPALNGFIDLTQHPDFGPSSTIQHSPAQRPASSAHIARSRTRKSSHKAAHGLSNRDTSSRPRRSRPKSAPDGGHTPARGNNQHKPSRQLHGSTTGLVTEKRAHSKQRSCIKEWCATRAQLKTRADHIEKDCLKRLTNYRQRRVDETDLFDLLTIEKFITTTNEARMKEHKSLNSEVNRVKQLVGRFAAQVEVVKDANMQAKIRNIEPALAAQEIGAHAEELGKRMESVEDGLLIFKTRARTIYQELLEEERGLTEELDAFRNRLEAEETNSKSAASTRASNKQRRRMARPKTSSTRRAKAIYENTVVPAESKDDSRDNDREINGGDGGKDRQRSKFDEEEKVLKQEIQVIEHWIISHGDTTGGWDEGDHNEFLRLRARLTSNRALIRKCSQELPNVVE